MKPLIDVTRDLMVAIGQATQQDYVVALVNPEEYEDWYVEEQGDRHARGELMTVWQPLTDLGWDNFFCDDENIIVRFEVTG